MSGRKANAFDFIRIAAALGVLYSHSFALLGLPQPLVFGHISAGEASVFVFFVVSGYLVCQSWQRDPHPLRFSLRRALRVLPGLFVSVLFTTFVVGVVSTSLPVLEYLRSEKTWAYLLSNLSLICGVDSLPGVFDHNPFPDAVNGSLWSLRYEVLMYACLALAAWGLGRARQGLHWTCGVMFFGFAAAWCLGTAFGHSIYAVPLPGLWRLGLEFDGMRIANLGALFFAGSLLQLWRQQLPNSTVAAIVLLSICAWLANSAWMNPLMWIALPYAVIVAAHRLPAALRVFGNSDYSYGIYIYAFPVQQMLSAWGSSANWTWLALLPLEAAVTIALAAASWHFIERPALAWKAVLKPAALAHARA